MNMAQYYVYVHCLSCLNYENHTAWKCSMLQTQTVHIPNCSCDRVTHNVAYIFHGRFNFHVEDNLILILYKCSTSQ